MECAHQKTRHENAAGKSNTSLPLFTYCLFIYLPIYNHSHVYLEAEVECLHLSQSFYFFWVRVSDRTCSFIICLDCLSRKSHVSICLSVSRYLHPSARRADVHDAWLSHRYYGFVCRTPFLRKVISQLAHIPSLIKRF